MSSSFNAKRVRIKFNDHPMLTAIFDADTGEPLYDVTCLELKLDIPNDHYSALITDDSVMDPELQGEVIAEVSEVLHLSDATLDALVRKIEQRIASRTNPLSVMVTGTGVTGYSVTYGDR